MLVSFAACGGDEDRVETEPVERRPDLPVVIAPDAPIALGVSAPITGSVDVTGTEDRDAVIVAVERWKEANRSQIGGHDIEVVVEDDGCTEGDITVAAARRLVGRSNVVAVVGPNCSAGAVAALPIYADAGVTVVSGSATQTDLTTTQPPGGFFFRTAYRNDLEAALIGLFVTLDLQGVDTHLVDDGESYGRDLADAAAAIMERSGVDVTRTTITPGTVDFSELVQQIVDEDPPVVGFTGFNPEAALFYRQLRDAGFRGVFGGGDAAATPEFIDAVGELAEGTLFAGCLLTLPPDVVADFVDVHGDQPSSAFVAQQMDATTILLDAVAAVGEPQADGSLVVDPRALRDAVRSTTLRDGVSGSFTFDDNGDRVPSDGTPLSEVTEAGLASQDMSSFVDLGLVPCQVQDGEFVNLLGPGAQPME